MQRMFRWPDSSSSSSLWVSVSPESSYFPSFSFCCRLRVLMLDIEAETVESLTNDTA